MGRTSLSPCDDSACMWYWIFVDDVVIGEYFGVVMAQRHVRCVRRPMLTGTADLLHLRLNARCGLIISQRDSLLCSITY
jgi:hypothetical protein